MTPQVNAWLSRRGPDQGCQLGYLLCAQAHSSPLYWQPWPCQAEVRFSSQISNSSSRSSLSLFLSFFFCWEKMQMAQPRLWTHSRPWPGLASLKGSSDSIRLDPYGLNWEKKWGCLSQLWRRPHVCLSVVLLLNLNLVLGYRGKVGKWRTVASSVPDDRSAGVNSAHYYCLSRLHHLTPNHLARFKEKTQQCRGPGRGQAAKSWGWRMEMAEVWIEKDDL